MTGDELTYDYNFDPFSAKNVQKCLCGSDNCRGVLGPKPRDVKLAKTDAKKTVKTGKRKLEEMMGDEGGSETTSKAKKRGIAPATGRKRSLTKASVQVAKRAASALKKSVASMSLKGKKKKKRAATPPAQRRVSKAAVGKTAASKLAKKKVSGGRPASVELQAESMTIVAVADQDSEPDADKGEASLISVKRSVSPTEASRKAVKSPRRVIKLSPKARANAAIRLITQG
ncbi:hypothetical protein UVI_02050830 [Ustilaginoidea virens]|nr:hypothetical protein UVI_02050830 [Ustilaginoidea virens]